MQRLVEAYPDLADGRYVVLADFEQAAQLELCNPLSRSGHAACEVVRPGGGDADRGQSLQITLAGPMDALVLSNARAQSHFLRSDWTEFDLLIMSIYCSVPSLELEVVLASGSGDYRATAYSRVPTRSGWNVLRLDLAEVAGRIDLADVREIRCSLPDIDDTTQLLIDDVILASNQRSLFGDPANRSGDLYVQRRGRRWHVGAGGRFELVFSHGQIVAWHNLGPEGDPNRNLLGTAVLGPTPIVLPEADRSDVDPERDFSALGPVVVARQWMEEASEVRVVVGGDWRFVQEGGQAGSSSPYEYYIYTVYRSGQIYVHLECTTETPSWQAGEVGVAVSRQDDPGLDVQVHRAAQLGDPESLRHVSFACARSLKPEVPDLLAVMYDARTAPLFDTIHDTRTERLHLIASGGRTSRPVQAWNCMLTVWPPDACRGPGATQRALDYCQRPDIRLTGAAWITDRPGDQDHDGFDERQGCYTIRPQAGRITIELDGRTTPIHTPCFLIADTADRDLTVFFDYSMVARVGRDARGDQLVEVPEVIRGESIVEIEIREAALRSTP